MTESLRVVVGADHRGVEALERVGEILRKDGHTVEAFTCEAGKSCDYPDNAYRVATTVSRGEADRGILLCGSGIGMCMAANKVHGVRAALASDELTAEMSRAHNDANVLCLSADMLGPRLIEMIVQKWLSTAFEGGRHARRVRKIAAIEAGEDPSTIVD